MKRNLLYNCFAPKWVSCPSFNTGEWALNVEYLCKYAHVFNNRKIVIVRESPLCHPPEEVEAAFAPLGDVEFIRLPNSPELGEVPGWADALARLESLDSNEITFYAHTKGTKYQGQKEGFMRGVRKWRHEMYDHCLQDVGLVEEVLSKYACAGCFRQDLEIICALLGQPIQPLVMGEGWHFAGTFWWVNHKELFSMGGEKGWRYVYPAFYGIEGYLGRLFPIERSFCLHKDVIRDLGGYLFTDGR